MAAAGVPPFPPCTSARVRAQAGLAAQGEAGWSPTSELQVALAQDRPCFLYLFPGGPQT